MSDMPKEDINEKTFDDATLIKLDIFEKYFEEWLPVWLYQPKYNNVLITDFFSGSGCDAAGNPGSPLRILRTLNKFHDDINRTNTTVRVILNDIRANKISRLRASIESKPAIMEDFQGLVSIEYQSESFQNLFLSREDEYRNQPNFFFMDQYGIKEVNDAVFNKLISFNCTDFLFFISSSYIRRFARDPAFRGYFPGLDPNILLEARYENIHRIMLDYYRAKLPEDNNARLYPFSIRKGPNIYGLVFGSKHRLGVEKFLKIAWDKNRLNGEANFDIDEDFEKRQQDLFEISQQLTKLEIFEKELENLILKRKVITNRELYDYTLESGHPPKHTHDIVSKLKKTGRIEWDSRPGFSYDTCYKKAIIKEIRAVTHE
jgi:three-Cys-motif partner protein